MIEGKDYVRIKGVDWFPIPIFRKYKTLHDFEFTSHGLGIKICIKEGAVFDGPSMLPLINSSTRSLMRASLFHDKLYTPDDVLTVEWLVDRPKILSQSEVDFLFYHIAINDNCPNWLIKLANIMIWIFGDMFWSDSKDGIYESYVRTDKFFVKRMKERVEKN